MVIRLYDVLVMIAIGKLLGCVGCTTFDCTTFWITSLHANGHPTIQPNRRAFSLRQLATSSPRLRGQLPNRHPQYHLRMRDDSRK